MEKNNQDLNTVLRNKRIENLKNIFNDIQSTKNSRMIIGSRLENKTISDDGIILDKKVANLINVKVDDYLVVQIFTYMRLLKIIDIRENNISEVNFRTGSRLGIDWYGDVVSITPVYASNDKYDINELKFLINHESRSFVKKEKIMTKRELIEIIQNVPDNAEIGINTIYDDESGEFTMSPICEVHYDENCKTLCITPEKISM